MFKIALDFAHKSFSKNGAHTILLNLLLLKVVILIINFFVQ